MRKDLSQRVGKASLLPSQLPVADSQDLKAQPPQFHVPGAIVLKRLASAVVAVAVRLHDQPLLAPEEVDREAPHDHVYLRHWEPVATAEAEEVAFQLAPGAVMSAEGLLNIGIERKAEHFGLTNCLPH